MSGNFLEHYAASHNRTISWANGRLQFLAKLANFLASAETEEQFRDWDYDYEKMRAADARSVPIGSGDFTYWQGASREAGMTVGKMLADIRGARASQDYFEQLSQAEAEKENEY